MTLNIAAVSYGIAALTFLLLTLSLLIGRQGRSRGAWLALASAVSVCWAASIGFAHAYALDLLNLIDVFEILRNAAWFVFLLQLLRTQEAGAADNRSGRHVVVGILAYCGILLALTVYGHLGQMQGAEPLDFFASIVGRVVLAVMGLVLVEQLFRNTDPRQRWGIKYLCLALGGIFAFDFYLYSDAMLFRHIDPTLWAARGIVNALTLPLIMVSAARNPEWELDVHVSRRFAFHTAALLGAGVYLLFMAGAGYYLRVFGGNWGAVLQTVFLFGAAIVLLAVLFSGTLRARFRVFLSKHFFHYKYDYRDEWLHFTRLLSEGEPGVRLRERSIQAIAGLVESPAGALWLAPQGTSFVRVAYWNMAAEGSEPVDSDFSRYLERRQWVVNLDEYQDQPELYEDLALPEWVAALPRAWLVVPLILHDRLLGFMVLARSLGQISFNWEVSDLLKTAARQAATNLAQMEAAEALMEARQFESFNRTAAFVVHDLKNLVTQLSLLLTNAQKHKHDPEFQEDMISTVESSVERMNRLLTQLRRGGAESGGERELELGVLLQQTLDTKSAFRLKPALKIEHPVRVRADRERLLRVLGHIVQNALEATPYEGKIEIRLTQDNGNALLEIEDSGCGMDESFIRERLFRPFDSTKGSGMGIGAYECREYIRELGGQIEVTSRVAQGTTFYIQLPLAVSQDNLSQQSGEGMQG